jgi:hypothetical protein
VVDEVWAEEIKDEEDDEGGEGDPGEAAADVADGDGGEAAGDGGAEEGIGLEIEEGGGVEDGGFGREEVFGGGWRHGCVGVGNEGSDEAVADAGDGFEVEGMRGVVAEMGTEVVDGGVDAGGGVGGREIEPDVLHDLFVRDEFGGALEEERQEAELGRGEAYVSAATVELLTLEVEFKGSEPYDFLFGCHGNILESVW